MLEVVHVQILETVGKWVDRARAERIVDLVENIMKHFNLPVPEGVLLYILTHLRQFQIKSLAVRHLDFQVCSHIL